jgi:hypothetical protein
VCKEYKSIQLTMISSTDFGSQLFEDIELNARIPPFMLDKINQDILQDPVRASDGLIYSRASIESWFSMCESLHLSMSSPCTFEEIENTLESQTQLTKLLHKLENHLHVYRRQAMADGSKVICSQRKSAPRFVDAMLSLHRLSKLHNAVATAPIISLEDISLFCETAKIAIIGMVGCGKSQLIEKLTMYSLFPHGEPTTRTRMPVIVKMRHSQTAQHSFPVLRVIDTNKKVHLTWLVHFGSFFVLFCNIVI